MTLKKYSGMTAQKKTLPRKNNKEGKSINELLAQWRDMPKWKSDNALSDNIIPQPAENVNTQNEENEQNKEFR